MQRRVLKDLLSNRVVDHRACQAPPESCAQLTSRSTLLLGWDFLAVVCMRCPNSRWPWSFSSMDSSDTEILAVDPRAS